ncbi:MAG: hypothetical protein M0R80_08130 [Proteobacteria bacterium]|jgi:hypothetical protein|nr:hypothetical protein [Pseudomonadota bacterium]
MKRKYTLNELAFNKINENSAYWIGFLMADGCITTRKNSSPYLNLSISEKDKNHIDKFKKFLQSNQPTFIRKNHGFESDTSLACISISSYALVKSLATYGVVPKKSHIARICSQLKNNRNFWRGEIDGDGWILTTFNHLPAIGLVGSETIVKQFEAFVKKLSPKCNAQSFMKKNKKSWQFQTSGTHAYVVIKKLYNNCETALDRKHELAANIIKSNFKSSKKDFSDIRYNDLLEIYNELGTWTKVAKHIDITYTSLFRLMRRIKPV